MKLIQIVGDLASFDTDDTENTIYASEPWTTDCEATVAPESRMHPAVLERLNMKYFLEVFIARDFLDDWTASLEEGPNFTGEMCEIDSLRHLRCVKEATARVSERNGDISTVEHRILGMTCLHVDIVGFADESFPGFVHCDFTDAKGNRHTVLEKIPVVTTENLWSDSTYPQPGMLPCERVEGLNNGAGPALALVSINPIGSGYPAQFIVLESQLVNDC